MFERIAVHFRRGREEEPRILRLRQAECVVRAERTDFQGLNRKLEIVDRTRGRREVQHAVEMALHVHRRRDIVPDEPEAGVAGQMREVVRMTGDEVVDADDLMFVVEKAVAEMRAEKTGGAGHQNSHKGPVKLFGIARSRQSRKQRPRTCAI